MTAAAGRNAGRGGSFGGPTRSSVLLLLLLLSACSVSPGERLARADLALASGKIEEAIVELDRGLEAAPRSAPLHERRALALSRRGGATDLEEAEEAYRTAIRLDPSHAAAFAGLGRILWDSGRKEDAQHFWRQLLALPATDDPVAAMERAKIRILLLATDEREQEAQGLLDEAPASTSPAPE